MLVVSIGFNYYQSNNRQNAAKNESGIAQNTVEWKKQIVNRSGSKEGIKIPGYGEISVSEGAKEMEMALVNPKDNPCYFQFTVLISVEEKQVTLYESQLIEQGRAITVFPVENLPSAGDYKMKVKINTYSLKDRKTPLNGAQVNTVLHVV
ncbi:hypothetical protein lbkm_0021 [Lachnospiraceae bacterium KM106-2]|nr:hypothetical protein lbkm_0021 [Lachnospiraceae bacterium KM106-2]